MPSLTRDQACALDPSKSIWIHASAGSGKTSVLTQRVMRLLLAGALPCQIVCLTFTKKAAQEMKERIDEQVQKWSAMSMAELNADLTDLLGTTPTHDHKEKARSILSLVEQEPLKIQTFHSFCHDLMCLFPAESGTGTGTGIIEPCHAMTLWNRAFDNVVNQAQCEQSALHKVMCRLAEKDLHMDEFLQKIFLSRLNSSALVDDFPDEKKKDIYTIFKSIMEEYVCLKGEKMDMDDLLINALSLFHNDDLSGWVMHSLNCRFKHLLLDEAQDTSPVQWHIFRFLVESVISNPQRTVFVVGDPKQSIYGFQGANLDDFFAMKNFVCQWVASCGGRFENIALNVSFRSCAPIIHAVNETFSGSDRLGVPFSPHTSYDDMRPGCAQYVDLSDQESPCDFWGDRIQKWIDSPFFLASQGRYLEKEDIMILLPRRTSFFTAFQNNLANRGLIERSSFSMESNKTLAILVALGQWILDCHHDEALAVILDICFSKKWPGIVFDASYGRQKRSIWSHICFLSQENTVWQPIVNTLRQWMSYAESCSVMEWYGKVLWGKEGMACWTCSRTVSMKTIDAFLQSMNRYMVTGSFLDFMGHVAYHQSGIIRLNDREDGVQLMTIHGSKGLQSPVVILPDVPPPFQRETPEYWRLLYVAMTRAQDRLYWSSCKEHKGWMPILKNAFSQSGTWDTTQSTDHMPKLIENSHDTCMARHDPEWIQGYYDPMMTQKKETPFLGWGMAVSKSWGSALHQALDELAMIDPGQRFCKCLVFLQSRGMSYRRARSWSSRLVHLLKRKDLHRIFFEGLSEYSIATAQGTVRPDRLLIENNSVWVVDFKSSHLNGGVPPLSVQRSYWEQMHRYERAVSTVYPGYTIRLSLLWLATGILEDVATQNTHD